MKRNRYIIVTLLVVGLIGSLFVYSNTYNADEADVNKIEAKVENQASLVDKKREVVTSDDLSEEINYKELVDSDIGKNINLNLMIENEFDEIERIANIEIEKQDDMEMIRTVYRNTETGNDILVAQSINELGDVKKYINEIKSKWYVDEEVKELLVKEYQAVALERSENESGLYVITDEYVYTFIGDRLDFLLEMAEKTPFK